MDADFSDDADGLSDYSNPYYFTGRRLDTLDSGNLELMYYRMRSYSQYLGRFYTEDPLGYIDGMNLYEYVKSNPISGKDPIGLKQAEWSGTITSPPPKFGLKMKYTVTMEFKCIGEDECTPSYDQPKVESFNLVAFPDIRIGGPSRWWIPINYGSKDYVEATIGRSTSMTCGPYLQGSKQVVVVVITHKIKLGWYWKGGEYIGEPKIISLGSNQEVLIIDCCRKCCKN